MPTLDHYATPLKIPMTIDQFSRIPRLYSYGAELHGGACEFTYRSVQRVARLRLQKRDVREVAGVSIGRIDLRSGQEPLAKLMAATLAHVAPMDTMAATTRRHAADAEMKHVAGGGHGPVIESACVGAFMRPSHRLIGTAIVTEFSFDSLGLSESMPATLPRLTWILVSPERQRQGIGSLLLDHVVNALAPTSEWLVSHFAPDNVPAALFHWSRKFELVPAANKS